MARRALVVVLVLGCDPALPRTAAAQFAPPAFTSVNPGARSSGMGGAFVALADDATAALSNPAGLLQLAAPEISFELHKRRQDSFVGGFGETRSTTTGLSYLSFVYPRRRWAAAAYRHEAGRWNGGATRPWKVAQTINITTYGGSASYAILPAVSVGAGLTVTRGHAESFQDFVTSVRNEVTGATKLGGNVGGLVTLIDRPAATVSLLQVGAMYRWQGRFQRPVFLDSDEFPYHPLAMPDVLTLGASVRLRTTAVTSFELTRLRHTEPVFKQYGTGYELIPRVGGEYVLPVRWSPAIRAGYYREGQYNEALENKVLGFRDQVPFRNHITFGAGASLSKNVEINFSTDLAARDWPNHHLRFRSLVGSAVLRLVK